MLSVGVRERAVGIIKKQTKHLYLLALLYRDHDCIYPAEVAELCQLFYSRLTTLDNDAIFTARRKHKHRMKRVIKHGEFPNAEEVPLACFTFLISVILIVNHKFNVLWITCTFKFKSVCMSLASNISCDQCFHLRFYM